MIEVPKPYQEIANKHPEAIKILIIRYYKLEPQLVHYCRLNDVPASDMYRLINAAKFYFLNNIKPKTTIQ